MHTILQESPLGEGSQERSLAGVRTHPGLALLCTQVEEIKFLIRNMVRSVGLYHDAALALWHEPDQDSKELLSMTLTSTPPLPPLTHQCLQGLEVCRRISKCQAEGNDRCFKDSSQDRPKASPLSTPFPIHPQDHVECISSSVHRRQVQRPGCAMGCAKLKKTTLVSGGVRVT